MSCPDPGVSKGPWALAIDGTHAKVRWEACKDGTQADLVFAPEAGGAMTTVTATSTPFVIANTYTAPLQPNAVPDYAGTYYSHEGVLSGLSPATCYTYHLTADPTRQGRFCTARNPGDPFTFVTMGDTNVGLGHTAGVVQNAVASKFDFTIHGGDLQYYDSFLDTWASWFPVMQPLLSQGGFFPAVGNHESEKPDEYQDYELRFFAGAGFDGTQDYYRFQSGGVWFFSLDTELDLDPGTAQGAWLAASLEDASKQPGFRFSIVYLHKPFVTCGDTGDNPDARAKFEPLFTQFKVPVVIQAHMHGYERFEFPGITYITAAGGGGVIGNPDANIQRAYCAQRVASGGFFHSVVFDVTTGKLDGKAVDETGVVKDTFSEVVP